MTGFSVRSFPLRLLALMLSIPAAVHAEFIQPLLPTWENRGCVILAGLAPEESGGTAVRACATAADDGVAPNDFIISVTCVTGPTLAGLAFVTDVGDTIARDEFAVTTGPPEAPVFTSIGVGPGWGGDTASNASIVALDPSEPPQIPEPSTALLAICGVLALRATKHPCAPPAG